MEKRPRKISDYFGSYTPRARRSKTRQMTAELQCKNENELQMEQVLEKAPYAFKGEVHSRLRRNVVDLKAKPDLRSRRINRSLEENLLAFLDGSTTADPDEILEDKMMFLEATHSMCVVPRLAHVPTPKMYQAILQFIQECNCVALTMSSFELLTDLEKRHPRVAITYVTSSDSGRERVELIIDQKVWSPLEETCKELAVSDRQIVRNSPIEISCNIFTLLGAIARRLQRTEKLTVKRHNGDRSDTGANYVVVLSQFMMLQHLMSLIQTDLSCRLEAFHSSNEGRDFTFVQESYLYRLICCMTPTDKKGFMMNVNSILDSINLNSGKEGMHESSDLSTKSAQHGGTTAGLQATTRDFAGLALDLVVSMMELDTFNREFDAPGCLSRRRSRLLFDSLLSICTKASTLDAYLKVVPDPSAKLKFVMEYFVTFAPKQAAQGLVDCTLTESMDKLLACFTDEQTLKGMVKVSKEPSALPVLLSHAFQAFLILHSLDDCGSKTKEVKNPLHENRTRVCKSMIIALNNMKSKEPLEMFLPIAEETLLVASRISALEATETESGVRTDDVRVEETLGLD